MDRRWLVIICGCLLLVWGGCSRSTEEYRTYSEGEDGGTELTQSDVANDTPVAAEPSPAAVETAPVAPTANVPDPAGPAPTELPRPPRVPIPERIAMLTVAGEPVSPAAATVSDEPREVKLLVPEKEFSRVDPGRSLRVSYDDLDLLKVLNMEPVPPDCTKHFPDWLTALDGAKVRIRGFMVPPPRDSGLPGFSLARDNEICCFGRDPKVYDVIPVFLKEGTTTDYIPNRPFDVVGRFHIRPDVFRGELENLYEIEDAEVIAR